MPRTPVRTVWILLILLAFPAARSRGGEGTVVDLKNREAMAVSVPRGTADGVTPSSTFRVTLADNQSLLLYPSELFDRRFWSQPLSEEEFAAVREGMEAVAVDLDPAERSRLRARGEARKQEIRSKREAAKREGVRQELEERRRARLRLEDRRDLLENRIAEAETALAEEEGRIDWLTDSEDRDIDRSLEEIGKMADQRDELQEQRNILASRVPYPRDEIERLTREIGRLNDRIASERGRIRTSRDRKRSARTFYQTERERWRKLVAERKETVAEIRALDRAIRELEESLR